MSGYNDGTAFKKLTSDKLLKVVALNDVGVRHFDDLVTGATTGTLDDGEAATIGYALQITGVAAIDEKKAARICAQRYPDLPIITTVDVLSHEAIEAALGRDRV